jgi:Zn finger protein HypA/HybF involved in hydrogenase expression
MEKENFRSAECEFCKAMIITDGPSIRYCPSCGVFQKKLNVEKKNPHHVYCPYCDYSVAILGEQGSVGNTGFPPEEIKQVKQPDFFCPHCNRNLSARWRVEETAKILLEDLDKL